MCLKEIIKDYEFSIVDKNNTKWDVIKTSDLAEICQEYHDKQLSKHI